MYESEAALVVAWQQGNEQATYALFNLYYPCIVRMAVLSGLALDDAQDHAQEVFLRAFEHRHQLRDPVAFPLWFQRIVTRNLLNTLKGKQRRKQVSFEEAGEIEESWERTQVIQPDEIAISSEWRAQLWRRVQLLPTNYRVVLVLRYYGDYSLREIAQLLGKREGAVRITMHRAMQQLRLLTQNDSLQPQIQDVHQPLTGTSIH